MGGTHGVPCAADESAMRRVLLRVKCPAVTATVPPTPLAQDLAAALNLDNDDEAAQVLRRAFGEKTLKETVEDLRGWSGVFGKLRAADGASDELVLTVAVHLLPEALFAANNAERLEFRSKNPKKEPKGIEARLSQWLDLGNAAPRWWQRRWEMDLVLGQHLLLQRRYLENFIEHRVFLACVHAVRWVADREGAERHDSVLPHLQAAIHKVFAALGGAFPVSHTVQVQEDDRVLSRSGKRKLAVSSATISRAGVSYAGNRHYGMVFGPYQVDYQDRDNLTLSSPRQLFVPMRGKDRRAHGFAFCGGTVRTYDGYDTAGERRLYIPALSRQNGTGGIGLEHPYVNLFLGGDAARQLALAMLGCEEDEVDGIRVRDLNVWPNILGSYRSSLAAAGSLARVVLTADFRTAASAVAGSLYAAIFGSGEGQWGGGALNWRAAAGRMAAESRSPFDIIGGNCRAFVSRLARTLNPAFKLDPVYERAVRWAAVNRPEGGGASLAGVQEWLRVAQASADHERGSDADLAVLSYAVRYEELVRVVEDTGATPAEAAARSVELERSLATHVLTHMRAEARLTAAAAGVGPVAAPAVGSTNDIKNLAAAGIKNARYAR